MVLVVKSNNTFIVEAVAAFRVYGIHSTAFPESG